MFITSKDILQEGERAQKGHGGAWTENRTQTRERGEGGPQGREGRRAPTARPQDSEASLLPRAPNPQAARGRCSAFTPWQVQAEPDTRPPCSHSGEGFLYCGSRETSDTNSGFSFSTLKNDTPGSSSHHVSDETSESENDPTQSHLGKRDLGVHF